MPPELNPLWIALEERRRQALGDLDREATRLAARPHARAWGRLEVIEHLVLVEEGTVRALRRPLPPGTRRRLRQRLGRAAVWLVFRFGIRVRAPVRGVQPSGAAAPDELRERWARAREELRSHLDGLAPEALARPVFRHPVAGPLTPAETLRFLLRHLEHHLRQLRRIRTAAEEVPPTDSGRPPPPIPPPPPG